MGKRKKNKKSKISQVRVMALLQPLSTKGDIKNSGIETLKSIGIGVVGGGVAGAAVGKSSLAWGALATFAGHYAQSTHLKSFGLGMMASGGYQIGQSAVNGSPLSGLDGAKERVKAFTANLKERMYLDKLAKLKDDAVNGLDNVQYFKYPNEGQHIDMGSLDNIEREIAISGQQYENQFSGGEDDISGVEDRLY
jgi:hypothetical protein